MDHYVELREVFRLADLATGQELCCREIFQVLVVGYNVDRRCWSFEIMLPYFEDFKNSKEFLVVDVIVEFQSGKCSGVKSDQMYFSVVRRDDGKDHCEGVVRSAGF
jgi:hypothetical protein